MNKMSVPYSVKVKLVGNTVFPSVPHGRGVVVLLKVPVNFKPASIEFYVDALAPSGYIFGGLTTELANNPLGWVVLTTHKVSGTFTNSEILANNHYMEYNLVVNDNYRCVGDIWGVGGNATFIWGEELNCRSEGNPNATENLPANVTDEFPDGILPAGTYLLYIYSDGGISFNQSVANNLPIFNLYGYTQTNTAPEGGSVDEWVDMGQPPEFKNNSWFHRNWLWILIILLIIAIILVIFALAYRSRKKKRNRRYSRRYR